jgi:hypothetical protein
LKKSVNGSMTNFKSFEQESRNRVQARWQARSDIVPFFPAKSYDLSEIEIGP